MATAPTKQNHLYLTPAETADALRVSDRHLRELTRNGAVPSVRLSQRVVRYRRDEIERLANAGQNSGTAG